MLSLSPATIAALRADYTDVSPTRESPDPRLVALVEDYERLRALLAPTALLPSTATLPIETIGARLRRSGLERVAWVAGILEESRRFRVTMEAAVTERDELRALQADQQRAFAIGLEVATAPLEPLRTAARALLADLEESLDGCLICGDEDGHTDDCTAAALTALLAPPKPSPRRVPGRPAGQRLAEEPTAEAREVLGLDGAQVERWSVEETCPDGGWWAVLDRCDDDAGPYPPVALFRLQADADRYVRARDPDDADDSLVYDASVTPAAILVDGTLAVSNDYRVDDHAALSAALEAAPRVDTTVPDETIQACRYFVHDGDGYDSSYTSPDEARKAAEAALDRWKADARDNDWWADEVRSVAWGEVIERAEAVPDEHAEDDEERGVDYRLTNCRVPVVAPKES